MGRPTPATNHSATNHNGRTNGHAQTELPLFAKRPTIIVPTVQIPQPDGSILIKAGKAIIVCDEMTAAEAAKELGMAVRTIERQCELGLFKSAFKPGGRVRSKWKISREEVLARRTRPAEV